MPAFPEMTLEREDVHDGDEPLREMPRVVERLIFHIASLMRASPDFKDAQIQASGFKSAVDFKWAEQFNRSDIQLQECWLFEDHLPLRGYKYDPLLQFASIALSLSDSCLLPLR